MTNKAFTNNVLIFLSQTFTLERQSALINLTPKKPELPNGHLSSSPLPDKPFIYTPPIAAVVTPKEADESSVGADDFDFDISKDMDDILDSDDEDASDESQSDVFEEIEAPVIVPSLPPPMTNGAVVSPMPITPVLPASPNIPMNLALPATPVTNGTPGGYSSSASTNGANTKKRKLKMASAPIRHPGIVSPLASTPPITNNTLHVSHPISNPHAVKRIKTSHQDDTSSSSGSDDDDSSSGSGSESGSTETGSSSESESDSGSDSDDEDMESLAQDISMSLSKGGPSAPASPIHQQPNRVNTPGMPSPSNYKKSPYETHSASNTPTPTGRQTQASSSAGPMSLRALFSKWRVFFFFFDVCNIQELTHLYRRRR